MSLSDAPRRAEGRWKGLLPLLGVDSRFLTNKHGPCPCCGGKDRFRFDDLGRGRWICGQCGAGDGFTLICRFHGWTFKEAVAKVEALCGTVPRTTVSRPVSNQWQLKVCRETWGSANRVHREDPVTRYLDARGLTLDEFPRSIRATPRCRFQERAKVEYHPAMLAQIVTPDDHAVGLHRTYLDDVTFTKLPIDNAKKIFGTLPAGAAVRLAKPAATMGISEGIENALAARALWKVPTWAALSAERLMTWEPPQGTKEVFIFADNDLSYTGQAVGYGLARKLHNRGIAVRVCVPDKPGDWNDALLVEKGAPKQE